MRRGKWRKRGKDQFNILLCSLSRPPPRFGDCSLEKLPKGVGGVTLQAESIKGRMTKENKDSIEPAVHK